MRDYDKEPLIIKDCHCKFRTFWFITTLFIIVCSGIYDSVCFINLIPFIIITNMTSNNNNGVFKFTSKKIIYSSATSYKEIKVSDINSITKTMEIFYNIFEFNKDFEGSRYQLENKDLQTKICVLCFVFILISYISILPTLLIHNNKTNIYFIIMLILFFSIFLLQLIYHLIYDKRISIFSDLLIINSRNTKISIFLQNYDDYLLVKKYLLDVKKMNIK